MRIKWIARSVRKNAASAASKMIALAIITASIALVGLWGEGVFLQAVVDAKVPGAAASNEVVHAFLAVTEAVAAVIGRRKISHSRPP